MNPSPQKGDIAYRREHAPREIMKTFTDAAGQPYVIWQSKHAVTLKAWNRWMKRTGAFLERPRTRSADSGTIVIGSIVPSVNLPETGA